MRWSFLGGIGGARGAHDGEGAEAEAEDAAAAHAAPAALPDQGLGFDSSGLSMGEGGIRRKLGFPESTEGKSRNACHVHRT